MTNDRKARAAQAEQMRKEREKSERRQRNIISVVIVALIVALIGVGGWAVQRASGQNERVTEEIQPNGALDDYGFVYGAFAPVASGGDSSTEDDADADSGADDASTEASDAVRVELFEDFLCPHCGQFEAINGQFLRDLADDGTIELIYRPFSFMHTASTNDYSRRAANIAACAYDQGGAEDFGVIHELLYLNQPAGGGAGPTNANLIDMADNAGITGLDECVRTERFVPWVNAARDYAASEREVSGTPTVFINGELSQASTPQDLQAAIDAAAAS